MQEIGGYFEFEHFWGKEYHCGSLSFNTAKNALLWLIGKRKIQRIWMPQYLCGSVIEAVKRTGTCEICWYPVDGDLHPDLFAQDIAPQDAVYLVNYYGQLPMSTVAELKEKMPNLILDNVQAFFEKPVPGVDTLYSCRKWFGVPDGAYLYADGLQQEELPLWRTAGRFAHLLGRFEENASAWYEEYQKAETLLDNSPICGMSSLTRDILRAVDYEKVLKRRTDNFSLLHDWLKDENQLNLHIPFGAFMYPFCLESERAREVRQKLIANKVYVPILWPHLQGKAAEMAERILPLPVDQRYSEKEMCRIVEILKR